MRFPHGENKNFFIALERERARREITCSSREGPPLLFPASLLRFLILLRVKVVAEQLLLVRGHLVLLVLLLLRRRRRRRGRGE